jgi:putative FmdB family regulatory protein
MPLFDFKCDSCGHIFEYELNRGEKLPECPVCKSETRKYFGKSDIGIGFKGSGFYVTDYKKGE